MNARFLPVVVAWLLVPAIGQAACADEPATWNGEGALSAKQCLIVDIEAGARTVPWQHDQAATGSVWTLAVSSEGAATLAVAVLDGDGKTVADTRSTTGRAVIADLGLDAGTYIIALSGRTSGPATLELTETGSNDGGFAAEPDGTVETAGTIIAGRDLRGRLMPDRSGDDTDILEFSVEAPTLADLVLTGPEGSRLALALLDEDGRPRQERRGAGRTALVDLGLAPGTHRVRVKGSLAPDQHYVLRLDDRGPPSDRQELEPNDRFDDATRMGPALTGRLADGEEDFLVFTVAGPPQLWRFQGAGDTLATMTIHNASGQPVTRATRARDTRFVRLSNIYLVPGRHVISLNGKAGPYLVRAIPMGPPPEPTAVAGPPDRPGAAGMLAAIRSDAEGWPLTSELEPNDEPERAIPLDLGKRHTGTFDRPDDRDVYAFHLTASQRVQIRLTADPEVELTATLDWGEPAAELDSIVVPRGSSGPRTWEGVLPAGDHTLTLRGRFALSRAYAVELIRRPFFDGTGEVEPNDDPHTATPVAPDMRVRGDLSSGGPDDIDWISLPARHTDTVLTVAALDGSGQGRRVDAYALLPREDGAWTTRRTRRLGTVVSVGADSGGIAVPAGTDVVLKIGGTPGPYALILGHQGQPVPPESRAPDVAMTLDLETDRVAAFARMGQAVRGRLRLIAPADITVRLDSHAGDASWRIAGLPSSVDLKAGIPADIPLSVTMPPDLWDADSRAVSIRATGPDGGAVWTEAMLAVDPKAPEVAPRLAWPVPDALLGGINVAASGLGGTAAFPGRRTDLSVLIDGLVNEPGSIGFSGSRLAGSGIVLDLAGDRPHEVRGLILHHAQNAAYSARLAEFSVAASLDGETYVPVGTFRMAVDRPRQAIVFQRRIRAAMLKIRAIANHDPTGTGSRIEIDEIEVVAAPDALGPDAPEIGLLDRGGHVITFTPFFDAASVLDPNRKAPVLRTGNLSGPDAEWVVGFASNRAALVAALTWHDGADLRPDRRAARVAVAASVDGPYGPWTPVGDYTIDDAAPLAVPLHFDGPVWARYLRFRVHASPDRKHVTLPTRIEVREAPAAENYRSVLGAWGRDARDGFYEFAHPSLAAPRASDDNDTRETADPLVWQTAIDGEVSLGLDIDWFAFIVPETGGTFSLTVKARPAIEVSVELFDAVGRPVALDFDPADRLDRVYRTRLSQGRHFLKVTEIPRSIVIAWDTSGSVSSYVPMVFRAVRGFARDISGDRESVRFLPFGDPPRPLPGDDVWVGDPVAAAAALHEYDRRNQDSSNTELALATSMDLLAAREGVRAIIAITDAVTNGHQRRPEVWQAMREMRPRVFTLTVPRGGSGWPVREPATALRDWAVENGGFNQVVSDRGAIEQAFRRVAAWLRRPAPYQLIADLDLTPPEPGFLTVTMDGKTPLVRNVAVEVILDASGSMLKRMDGTRRYLIAKRVLTDLVTDVLPREIPFALRVFGQGLPDSCDTNLQSPLAPLDPAEVTRAIEPIRPTNLAKTPIGDALRHVARDLDGADGPKLVILLTDGEETCDGDPAAEIRALRAGGVDVEISIVGFAIDDRDLASTFAEWAAAGGGGYFAAGDARALDRAMTTAVTPRFAVMMGDSVVATGRINDGNRIELVPGAYVIRVPGLEDRRVRIEAGQSLEHRMDAK